MSQPIPVGEPKLRDGSLGVKISPTKAGCKVTRFKWVGLLVGIPNYKFVMSPLVVTTGRGGCRLYLNQSLAFSCLFLFLHCSFVQLSLLFIDICRTIFQRVLFESQEMLYLHPFIIHAAPVKLRLDWDSLWSRVVRWGGFPMHFWRGLEKVSLAVEVNMGMNLCI